MPLTKKISMVHDSSDENAALGACDHNIEAIIKKGHVPAVAWIIWGTSAVFYFYEYILRVSVSVMTFELMRDFSVTSAALGILASSYYYAYTPLQVPAGVIVDRFGVRRVLTVSAILCAIGSLVFGKSMTLFGAQTGRMLMGAGSAAAYLCTAKLAAEWFPPRKFALLTSVTMGLGLIGATFGGKPFALMINVWGWRQGMVIAACTGVAVAVLSWCVIRDRDEIEPEVLSQEQQQMKEQLQKQPSLLSGIKIVASNPQSWLIGLYGCFMVLPLSAFAELWSVPYLMQRYHIDNEMAASASIMVFIGMALGCPFGAYLSDRLQSRIKVMRFAAVGTLVLLSATIYVPMPLFMMFVMLFITGFVTGSQILYFATAKEHNPARISATTIAFTNALVMSSAIIFQPLLGYLLDLFWDGTLSVGGVPIYGIDAYQKALFPIILSILVALILLRFVKETYPK